MSEVHSLHLFEGYGIELEYMIVDRQKLAVMPVADRVLAARAGEIVAEVEAGPLCWSNELVLHVIELKTNGPAQSLGGLSDAFQAGVREVNDLLRGLGGQMMPTAMHPWMDPHRETLLWPHENSPIYDAYNRIFGCQGHGWANLQSTHINLPFTGDEEFGRLHAAVRLVLPLLPALAASSPVMDGRQNGLLDNRLEVYRKNQRKIPQITGRVIPEPVFSRSEYEAGIFAPIYQAVSPFDPEGILQHEWLNSRGAIARFDRNTIEIRVLDVQECPRADLAIVTAIVAVLQALVAERWSSYAKQRSWPIDPLAEIFEKTIALGENAPIDDPAFLKLFGYPEGAASAGTLWRHLVATLLPEGEAQQTLKTIIDQGPLARRIQRALGGDTSPAALHRVYGQLCQCLETGELFYA